MQCEDDSASSGLNLFWHICKGTESAAVTLNPPQAIVSMHHHISNETIASRFWHTRKLLELILAHQNAANIDSNLIVCVTQISAKHYWSQMPIVNMKNIYVKWQQLWLLQQNQVESFGMGKLF